MPKTDAMHKMNVIERVCVAFYGIKFTSKRDEMQGWEPEGDDKNKFRNSFTSLSYEK